MSQENVETVRSIFARRSEGDFESHFDLFDEHVVVVLRGDFPDAGAYHGHDELRAYSRGFLEPWTHLTMEAEEIIDAGDTIVVHLVQRATGDASGAETELRYYQLWTFRGDKVVRLENIRDRADAFEIAGLDEQPSAD